MLTADLSGARRRGKRLTLPAVDEKTEALARELAEALVKTTTAHVGRTRGELLEALGQIEVGAQDRKLLLGLRKVLDDKAEFEVAAEGDPAALRMALFTRAAARRRACKRAEELDRRAVLVETGAAFELGPEEVEAQLFADLKEAQRLTDPGFTDPAALVEAWRLGRVQAVLLKATRVVATVGGAEPDVARRLFSRLKLLQLLFTVEEVEAGYRLTIDGPLSLFGQSTRYGLKLAVALKSLLGLPRCEIEADLAWGKGRAPLSFTWSADELPRPASVAAPEPPHLRDEVQALLDAFAERRTPWKPAISTTILHLPGAGLCIPDLDFVDEARGARVHLEVLGFWSREAVWRRVELVEAGLQAPIVFAVSSRLRVSEAALDEEKPGCLYVFKGALRAAALEDRLEQAWAAHQAHTG